MLGRGVDLKALGQGAGGGRVEDLVQGIQGVRVDVVHHQHHRLGLKVVAGQQPVDLVRLSKRVTPHEASVRKGPTPGWSRPARHRCGVHSNRADRSFSRAVPTTITQSVLLGARHRLGQGLEHLQSEEHVQQILLRVPAQERLCLVDAVGHPAGRPHRWFTSGSDAPPC